MESKFSYFDFISYFVPGTILLWSISLIDSIPIRPPPGEANLVVNSLIFIVLSFVLGHLIQAVAKWLLEKLIKYWWWKGCFFSDLYLSKGGPCAEFKRQRFIEIAKERFRFDAATLEILEKEPSEESHRASYGIYRTFDAFSRDHGLGEKAHTANTLYNFFRGLSGAFFLSALIFLGHWGWVSYSRGGIEAVFAISSEVLVSVGFGLAALVFLKRARERGELYVAGVFDSVLGYFSEKE